VTAAVVAAAVAAVAFSVTGDVEDDSAATDDNDGEIRSTT